MSILAENIHIGKNSMIAPSVHISGVKSHAKNVYIGDNVFIGDNVQIFCDDFSIGDYSKIHHDTNIHGYKPCHIGHNAWIGQFTIIDCIGGTIIGDNCGIGAHSQLWSHIKYGDTLEGCNFSGESKLTVGNDVWFVGHCIVSPITAEDKSMALVGSVVTRDMKYNEIYAGNPAASISHKIGYQFKAVSIEEKLQKMNQYLIDSGVNSKMIKIVASESDFKSDGLTYFAVSTRRYTKNLHEEEIKFMRYLLPEKAKFVPISK